MCVHDCMLKDLFHDDSNNSVCVVLCFPTGQAVYIRVPLVLHLCGRFVQIQGRAESHA